MTPDYKAALDDMPENKTGEKGQPKYAVRAFTDINVGLWSALKASGFSEEWKPCLQAIIKSAEWLENNRDTIRLALTEAAGKQWQDIETAPKDGTPVLAHLTGCQKVSWFKDGAWRFDDTLAWWHPTEYRHLSASPTASSGGGE